MAQQETGMGWSANSEYLIQATGQIANCRSFGGSAFPGQPIPRNCASATDVILGGFIAYSRPNENEAYYFGVTGNADVVMFAAPITAGQPDFVNLASPASGVQVIRVRYNYQTQTIRNTTTLTLDSHDSGTGYYYVSQQMYYSSWSPIVNIPQFSTLYEGLNAIQVIDDYFYKLNAGYAVACLAKWYTQNGTFIISPVLISSNTDYTDMSFDDPSHSLAKLNMLLQGVRFYMAFFDLTESDSVTTTLPVVDLTDRGNLPLDQVFMTIISTSYAHVIIISSPDPYETEGGGSGEEGGDGEETGDDDAGIEAGSDFPSAINTGFCRIFSPSESELRDLSNYLWSNSYDLAQVKKLFSNPMDSILGLSAVPIRLLGSSVSFSLGGVPITGMTLPLVSQQRYTYHMGTITIKERWGSYLDYDPYTKFSIFLPFIGMRELAADDIMGKTVGLVYDIDILTGMCVARLQAGTNCLYEWGGNCAIQLPINSRNWDSVFSTAVSAVGGIVSAVTGGSAPLVAGSVASAALQTVSMKPRIDKSSTIGGAAGWLGQMTPYIIRTTPEAFIPTDQNKFIGYPAYINVALDSISGYNEVESIHLENVTATGAELEEIESILKGGVIF